MPEHKPIEITLNFTPVSIERYEATTRDALDGTVRHTPAFTAYGMTDGFGSYWTVEVPDFAAGGVTVSVQD